MIVPCRYRLSRNNEASLVLGRYDVDTTLVIDPVLTDDISLPWGNGSQLALIADIAVDSNGYIYLAGSTAWADFPVTPGPLGHFSGSRGFSAGGDVFVVKFAPDRRTIVWSVLVGGTGDEFCGGIAVDSEGSVYVAGQTDSPDFPVTSQPANSHAPAQYDSDLFVFKLTPQGTALVYSTLIGGSRADMVASLALAPDHRVALVGGTTSADFPVTPDAVQGALNPGSTILASPAWDAVVVRLDAAGVVDYATYLGGPREDYATDVAFGPTGDIYVAGYAEAFFPTLASSFAPNAEYGGFISRLDHASGQFVYSTYLPGVSNYRIDYSPGVLLKVDASGNAYAAGAAEFVFPTTPGAFQTDVRNNARTAFVLELNEAGTDLVFSTLIGGNDDELAQAIELVGDSVVISGVSNSIDFPATDYSMPLCDMSAFTFEGYVYHSMFVASFDHTGRLLTSSRYNSGLTSMSVAGMSQQGQELVLAYSALNWYWPSVAWIDLGRSNPVQIMAVADAASYQVGPISPLEIVCIFGRGLGPEGGASWFPSTGYFPTQLGGVEVSFDGIRAPLLYVSDGQINAIVPGGVSSMPRITVTTPKGVSASLLTGTEIATPAIFSANGSGVGKASFSTRTGRSIPLRIRPSAARSSRFSEPAVG